MGSDASTWHDFYEKRRIRGITICSISKIMIKWIEVIFVEFVTRYTYARTFKQKIHCIIAKLLRGHVVTPLGRIMLLPSDYEKAEKQFG